jgi:hypothetical protein
MGLQQQNQQSAASANERLLNALAEQLKLPLVQIAHGLETGVAQPKLLADNARLAIKLIDSFLQTNNADQQIELQLEPVSLSAVMQDVAHQLYGHAKRYDCDLQIELAGRYGPVMAHRANVQSAFLALGFSMVESAQGYEQPAKITLAAHRTNKGLVAGVFGSNQALSSEMFRRAQSLYGASKQPFTGASASSSVGVFIAESLLGTMNTQLRVAKFRNMKGLGATFLPSHQLQLVDI